ncbi:MAG: fibrobacter succinogenes major paralogous domain-containing protein [Deltaproteobacteria bacterium]|nr:fibrobacter succinogenes major paralogous domain-containing protein [Deltaproteobacteria bacterium]
MNVNNRPVSILLQKIMKTHMSIFIAIPLLLASLWLASCSSSSAPVNKTVTVGNQVWMRHNLDVSVFRNGDPIPKANSEAEWDKAIAERTPTWCYYNYDSANGAKYGKLYNWYAVNDPRGLAPKGWHIPSNAEWDQLAGFLGGESTAGTKMKSNSGWGNNGNGTDEFGLSFLPGGYYDDDNSFDLIGFYGTWWSSTKKDETNAWFRLLAFDRTNLYKNYHDMHDVMSVRCIKD